MEEADSSEFDRSNVCLLEAVSGLNNKSVPIEATRRFAPFASLRLALLSLKFLSQLCANLHAPWTFLALVPRRRTLSLDPPLSSILCPGDRFLVARRKRASCFHVKEPARPYLAASFATAVTIHRFPGTRRFAHPVVIVLYTLARSCMYRVPVFARSRRFGLPISKLVPRFFFHCDMGSGKYETYLH